MPRNLKKWSHSLITVEIQKINDLRRTGNTEKYQRENEKQGKRTHKYLLPSGVANSVVTKSASVGAQLWESCNLRWLWFLETYSYDEAVISTLSGLNSRPERINNTNYLTTNPFTCCMQWYSTLRLKEGRKKTNLKLMLTFLLLQNPWSLLQPAFYSCTNNNRKPSSYLHKRVK